MQQPAWLPSGKEREGIDPKIYIKDTQTNFLKGAYLARFLGERVLPVNPNPSVLVVGIGALKDPLWCPFIPYQVAAELDESGAEYRLDLLDINAQILSDIRTRRRIFLVTDPEELLRLSETHWKEYLKKTGQTDRVITERAEGLIFEWEAAGAKAPSIFTEDIFLSRGIHSADVPRRFHHLLRENRIRLIHGDIATYPLTPESYDAVDCTNVLYQMPVSSQKLAVHNVASSLKKGGVFRLNDIGGYYGKPLFEETGGWLSSEILDELRLSVELFEPEYNALAGFFTRAKGDNRPTSVNALLVKS
jgi:hypothetical protein